MIEIKKNESSGEFEFIVDGVTASKDQVKVGVDDFPSKLLFLADIYDLKLKQKVIAHRFSDLPDFLLVLQLKFDRDCATASIHKTIDIRPDDIHTAIQFGTKTTGHTISFECAFDIENWRQPWTMGEYVNECNYIFTQKNPPGFTLKSWGNDRFSLGFSFSVSNPVRNKQSIIESELSKHTETVCELLELTELSLMSKVRNNSVVLQFDFPEQVRVPCEQYLLYFVGFLKDLGVEATADIQHEAGQVLFAVTPTNKDEALDKIHSALKTYLELASSPISSSSDPEDEMAIQRLLANVDHLKSQLRLSYMMVRTQEATIQAQQTTILSQQRVLSGEVLLDSLRAVSPQPKAEDKEEVIDGVLALRKYDYKGLEVNLAEIYRRLKQLFKKNR
jgi:hypothetical protein